VKLFNRLSVALLCLALAGGSVALIVLAWTIPQESIDALREAVDWLDRHNKDLEKVVLTTGGAFLALMALLVLAAELMPEETSQVKITDLKVGEAVLSTADIGARVEEAVKQVANVAAVKAVVRARKQAVEVSLDLHVDPDANLATVSEEASRAVERVLAEKVHVELAASPRSRLHYRELRLGRAAARPVTPAPPPQPPVLNEGRPAPAADAEEAPSELAAVTEEGRDQQGA
jgi:hypothetical protein